MDIDNKPGIHQVHCYVCGKPAFIRTETGREVPYICTECAMVNNII